MTSKLAFVFPGQGSQSIGMGKFLFDNFKTAKDTYSEASEALGWDVTRLCFEGPDSELQLTANTQPALLTTSTATARVLQNDLGLKADLTAGHSIGEYASFVLAGVLPFSVALKAVRLRGQAMQSAVPVGLGGMVACMGLDESQVTQLLEWAKKNSPDQGIIEAANFNSPGQIVLSGPLSTLNWMRENARSESVFGQTLRMKFIPLNVSAPFHCQMMKPAEQKMAEFFSDQPFLNPRIPIYQNWTASGTRDSDLLKSNLIRQVSGSVRWMQSVQQMINDHSPVFIECGHGAVLKGLIKKTAETAVIFTSQNLEDFQIIKDQFKGSL
jgi:[acyl-carrier-protein] S-malonyltransferase